MKLITLFIVVALISPLPGSAQNLVPNPGFENYNSCPTNLSDIMFSPGFNSFPSVTAWVSPLQATTPDYYNICAAGTAAGIPDGGFGYKQVHSGNGYAGIIAMEGTYSNGSLIQDYREYLQTKLLQVMQAGQQYCVSFYVSTSIPGSSVPYNYISLDRLGINFSVSQFVNTSSQHINTSYGISGSLAAAKDTSIWIKISGVYTASGGEQWLMLGYFNDTPVYNPVYPVIIDSSRSILQYVYIDDISVTALNHIDTTHISHDTTLCNNTPTDIYLHNKEDASSYLWNTNETTADIHIQDTGTYWCISNVNCNYVADTFHVHAAASKPIEIAGTLANCNNEPVTVHVNGDYYHYQWSTGATTDSLVINQSGIYSVAVTDQCGIQYDTIHAYIQPPTPAPIAHDTVICQFIKDPILNVAGSNLTWYGAFADHFGIPQQPPIVTDDTATYTMFVSQTIGKCTSNKTMIQVSIAYTPQSALDKTVAICDEENITLGDTLPYVSYLWNTGSESCCITANMQGKYIRTATNNCGYATDTIEVQMLPCNKCVVFPNAFTPNGNGYNEVFKPELQCDLMNYHLAIYNRWGNCIFRSSNPADGWDGTSGSMPVETGAYIYVLDYTSMAGKKYCLKGNVTVIR